MNQKTICYVDDSQTNLLLVKKTLSDRYHVVTIDTPNDAIALLIKAEPDLVLLDVNMPEIDGYEICRKIREEEKLNKLPIVFLTCRSSLQDRLTGFEAGGDAYVTKPFEFAELKHIIQSLLNRYESFLEAEDRAESATSMIMMMMQNNSEIGQVVLYARALSNARDEATLIETTFESLSNFGLNTTLMLNVSGGQIVARSDKKPFTPIEAELLELAKHGERIVNVGNKYLFCGTNCIFLIKNMPIEDEALTGRLRDHLAIMLESCDACVELVNYRQKEEIARQNIADKTQTEVMKEFGQIVSMFETLNGKAKQAFELLAINIEESFMFLGLSEEQESQLTSYIEQTKIEIDQYMDGGDELYEVMNRVAKSINELTKKAEA